jgi:hypothetical protein
MLVLIGIIAVVSLLSIDASLRKSSRQQEEIIELLKQIKEKR